MKYKVLEYYVGEIIDRENMEITQIWMRVDIDGVEKNLYLYREEYFDDEGDGKGDRIEVGFAKQFKDRYMYVDNEGEWIEESDKHYKIYEDIYEKLEDMYGFGWDIYSFDDDINSIEGEV